MAMSLLTMQQLLNTAIDDEYRAQARYAAAIERFGPVPPFANIVGAEARHVDALVPLFRKYGLEVPPDRWAGRVTAPETLAEACQIGIDGEIRNYQMYDRFLAMVDDPEAIAVFRALRAASHDRHLLAFEACVARETGKGPVMPEGPGLRAGGFFLGAAVGAFVGWLLGKRRPRA